ncbi:hypothetical protein KJ652_05650 [Patescibacteria group bacterium]|nr:hypothetical protein [Patescibacteria group bacterium]MBU1124046.1 hypothetical protein [Patescibacteria group bacterium]
MKRFTHEDGEEAMWKSVIREELLSGAKPPTKLLGNMGEAERITISDGQREMFDGYRRSVFGD